MNAVETLHRHRLIDWPTLMLGWDAGWLDFPEVISFAVARVGAGEDDERVLAMAAAVSRPGSPITGRDDEAEAFESYVRERWPPEHPAWERADAAWTFAKLVELADTSPDWVTELEVRADIDTTLDEAAPTRTGTRDLPDELARAVEELARRLGV